MVCEDDPDVATLLSLILSHGGYTVHVANTAAQARQLLTQHTYAAMTVDIMLPDEDGISLVRGLRDQEVTRTLPIVMVSAIADETRKALNGDAFGVIDWLQKPIDTQRLLGAIERAALCGKPRILHVEDDPDILSMVSVLLREIADVVPAVTLYEAKQQLARETFSIILLDLLMPDSNGLELLPLLCTSHNPTTPVIVFSALEVSLTTARQVAATLIKSRVTDQQLLNTVKSIIQGNCSVKNNSLKQVNG